MRGVFNILYVFLLGATTAFAATECDRLAAHPDDEMNYYFSFEGFSVQGVSFDKLKSHSQQAIAACSARSMLIELQATLDVDQRRHEAFREKLLQRVMRDTDFSQLELTNRYMDFFKESLSADETKELQQLETRVWLAGMRLSRAHYLLGRAYAADGQRQKSVVEYAKAAQLEYSVPRYFGGYERGYPMAAYALGLTYYHGLGNAPKDRSKAKDWARQGVYQSVEATILYSKILLEEGATHGVTDYLKFLTDKEHTDAFFLGGFWAENVAKASNSSAEKADYLQRAKSLYRHSIQANARNADEARKRLENL